MENPISAGHSLLNLLYSCGQLCGKLLKKALIKRFLNSFNVVIPTKPPHSPQLSTTYPHLGLVRNLIFRLQLNSVGELGDLVVDRAALSHQLANLSIRMHNSGVVAAAKSLANLWK